MNKSDKKMSRKGLKKVQPENEKKENIQIRVTVKEKKELKAKAESVGKTVSELLRTAAKRTRTWTAKDRKTELEKIKQLARIGNNINQLAMWCNTYKSGVESIDVITSILSLQNDLNQLREVWSNADPDTAEDTAA